MVSLRRRCVAVAPIWIAASPSAEIGVKISAIPVACGRINPIAPSTSAAPIPRTAFYEKSCVQAILGLAASSALDLASLAPPAAR